jgi:hypothetical protein
MVTSDSPLLTMVTSDSPWATQEPAMLHKQVPVPAANKKSVCSYMVEKNGTSKCLTLLANNVQSQREGTCLS